MIDNSFAAEYTGIPNDIPFLVRAEGADQIPVLDGYDGIHVFRIGLADSSHADPSLGALTAYNGIFSPWYQ